eukprot:g3171.t1
MSLEEQEVLTKLKRRALGRSSTKLFAPERKPGFSMVTNKEVLAVLQNLLTETHKATDNWTRDRGCALHGRHKCDTACIFKHRASVPTGFQLVRAERNRNAPLWHVYATTRRDLDQALCVQCASLRFLILACTTRASDKAPLSKRLRVAPGHPYKDLLQ